MRVSSLELTRRASRGPDAGCDVDDIGLCGTEMLYYAVGEYGYEGGFTVTASHNPKQYNGMKMVRRGALPVGSESGPRQDQGHRRSRASSGAREARRAAERDVLTRLCRAGASRSST